ncbi:hypothetical protein [Inediibacterium massiliense]|uniref:hypothetical protein n=1 Tax=Inediibacterium massiliense TaxID=1658111 RepID=UPI0006B46240|nr:hypothetical protein [Inediibacterium massiliense]
MKKVLLLILIIINIPVYKYLFHLFFENMNEFRNCIRYVLTPNIISLIRGEYWKDVCRENQLSLYIICCIVIVACEYFLLIILAKEGNWNIVLN